MEVKVRKAFRSGNVNETCVYNPGNKEKGHDEDSDVNIQFRKAACVNFSLGEVFAFAKTSIVIPWICYDH